ncbi:Mbov_0396 family ICE element transmembrane protein [Mycoplasma yeatsii]|uniref:Mbov_0396 family ICE element transmembrane protein n=1 Tax=Mycoplasma yeatsii TaxID=51365 RepID=UPI0005B24BFF|nr:hypothetical protein [Mycoplasma yeatsii]AJM71560.1 hypothetical protein MYE_00310 [Mycoplasma yeatsii GM274B]
MWGWVYWGLFNMGYVPLVKLPLKLLEAIIYLFQLIATELPQYLIFGIRFGQKFSEANIPIMFLRLSIVSIIVFAILFLASGIRIHFQKQGEENALSIAMKNSLTGTIWIISIPIILFLVTTIFNVILSLIIGENVNDISKTIFMSLKDPSNEKIEKNEWLKIANDNFNFKKDVFDKLENGQGILLIFLGGLTAIMTLIPFLLGALTLVQKIYQQFFLFIISPFICAASVGDNGKRMKIWAESYAAKSLSVIAMVIALQLYSVFITRATNWVGSLNEVNFFSKILLILAIIAGGAVATTGITSEITAFVGESASVRETMSETKNLMKTGMALAGGVGAVAAVAGRMSNASMGAKGFSRNRRNDKIQHAKQQYKKGQISRSDYLDKKYAAQQEHIDNKLRLDTAKEERQKMEANYDKNWAIYGQDPNATKTAKKRAKEAILGERESDYHTSAPMLALNKALVDRSILKLSKKEDKLAEKGKKLSKSQQEKKQELLARSAHLGKLVDGKTGGRNGFSKTTLNLYGSNKRVQDELNKYKKDKAKKEEQRKKAQARYQAKKARNKKQTKKN